jgi:Ni/Co efflux regulator RcnB
MIAGMAVAAVVLGAPNTDNIDYNRYDLDTPVSDMMWCGTSNEVILVLTESGTVYRSRDRGATWRKL